MRVWWNRTINCKRLECHPARSSWGHAEIQDTFRKVSLRDPMLAPASLTPLRARPRNATRCREILPGGNLRRQSLPGCQNWTGSTALLFGLILRTLFDIHLAFPAFR